MKTTINVDELSGPILLAGNVVTKGGVLPILSNLLVKIENDEMYITGSDLEIRVQTRLQLKSNGPCEFTIPARKTVDICKALPKGNKITLEDKGERIILRSGRSRYTLASLPANDYPVIESATPKHEIEIPEKTLLRLIDKTSFAMAQKDVRYYLNGTLLELENGIARMVATDGHRLALSESGELIGKDIEANVIVPIRAIAELRRLLKYTDNSIRISLSGTHIQVQCNDMDFTSKVIDGRFPDYKKIIPEAESGALVINRDEFIQALNRAAILSNEKYRGITITLTNDKVKAVSHNTEQEEAEEIISAEYSGEERDIGFNIGYLTDVLSVIDQDKISIHFNDIGTALIQTDKGDKYIITPMRL